MSSIHPAYLAMANAQAVPELSYKRGSMGLNDPTTAALRCFQRYSRDPHRDIVDGNGMTRWVTEKQARVHGIIARIAVSVAGTGTMKDIAAEACCTVSTVSRTIRKLQGWELYAVEVRRGRHGGITVHRKGWDRFADYVTAARLWLREKGRKAAGYVQKRKLATMKETYERDGMELRNRLRTMDASFSEYMAWRESRDVQATETGRSERVPGGDLGAG